MGVGQMHGVCEGQYFSCLFYRLFCFLLLLFKCTKSSRGKNSANSLEQKIRCLEKQRKEVISKYQLKQHVPWIRLRARKCITRWLLFCYWVTVIISRAVDCIILRANIFSYSLLISYSVSQGLWKWKQNFAQMTVLTLTMIILIFSKLKCLLHMDRVNLSPVPCTPCDLTRLETQTVRSVEYSLLRCYDFTRRASDR